MNEKITCRDKVVVVVRIGSSRKIYTSRKTARNKVAWRILYENGRLGEQISVPDIFGDGVAAPGGWANIRHECNCNEMEGWDGESLGKDSNDCPLHNRHNGYYKRLHDRIVRWLEKGYMAPDSGLANKGTEQ